MWSGRLMRGDVPARDTAEFTRLFFPFNPAQDVP